MTAGGIFLSYYDVEDLPGFTEYLDSNISRICFGPHSDRPLAVTKGKLRRLFSSKVGNETWICGSCAELFLHLYLNAAGYEQACLYFNLEENSAKKGFDGLYLREGEPWAMESKSATSGATSHRDKVAEAFRSLQSSVSDVGGNDPWDNAVSHAYRACVEGSVIKTLESLSDRFTLGDSIGIADVNIIPCATIFMGESLSSDRLDELGEWVDGYFGEREHGSVHVICVSHYAKTAFLRYIGLESVDE